MFFQAVALISVAILNLILGYLVYGRAKTTPANRIFFYLTVAVAAWAIGLAGFLVTDNSIVAITWAKSYYVAALAIAYTITIFAFHFPDKQSMNRKAIVLLALPPLLLGLLITSIPSFLTNTVRIQPTGNEVELGKVTYAIYSAVFIVYFLLGLLILIRKVRASRFQEKNHIIYMLVSITLAGFFGILFNLLLPLIGNYRLIWLGPLFSVVFISIVAIGIVRHRLFDVRSAVARSVAYIATLSFSAALFTLVVFGIASPAFAGESQISNSQRAFYFLFANIQNT